MHDPLHRLYRAKLALLAVLLLVAGLALLIIGHLIEHSPRWHWLSNWPIIDIGSGMFTTGLLGVALQYLDGADSEERDTERLRRVLAESAPAMRDAVINGFSFEPEDLARVSTPETLDQIVTNGLGIRLGDAGFAAEVYSDLREQAIGVPERLHDARIDVRLSMDRSTPEGRAPMFVATIRWEYDVRPVFATRRFVAMSDLDEFRSLKEDTVATSGWYVGPRTGLDASDRASFELVEFLVNGAPRTIRRSFKTESQTYSVSLGKEAMEATGRTHVAYTYRTLVSINEHLLQLRVDQPTKGLSIELDYTDTNIEHVSALDFITSSRRSRIVRTKPELPARAVGVEFNGWVFPRSGVAFVWSDVVCSDADCFPKGSRAKPSVRHT